MQTKSKKRTIPLYHLQERAAKCFEVTEFAQYHSIAHWDQAHRDDNYLFFYQESGLTKVIVDFQEVTISGCSIFCILPGQVHYGVSAQHATAWTLAVDAAYVNETFRTILTGFEIRNAAVTIDASKSNLFRDSFLLLKCFDKIICDNASDKTLEAMLGVCISLFVFTCQNDKRVLAESGLRPMMITRQFKSLLLLSFREMKSPSEYAAALNISPSYLNEVVKETTGQPVSYWIHQEIILEAKRMLFYTNVTVKEISHVLGYADTTYFIRLFSKTAGMSPLKFRSEYRK